MAKDLVTRNATLLYKERHMLEGRGVDELLFSTDDESRSAAFRVDRYISTPYGISYRDPNNQSVVRHFTPGTTELVEVPVASEKTPIDASLRDAVAAGFEATDSQQQNLNENIAQIIDDHMEAHRMTKFKQAIDVVRTGIFYAKGINGVDLGLNYDHGRDAAQSITYDFTGTGATLSTALKNLAARLDAKGTPKSSRVVMLGKDWANAVADDDAIQAYMQNNTANMIYRQPMMEQTFGGIEGLFIIGEYKPVGTVAPFTLVAFEPGIQYTPYKGADSEPFVPDDEAIAFSLTDKTFRIKRGVDVYDETRNVVRVVADMVFDRYSTDDPIVEFLRSHTRHIYIYGNIDHTARSVGTFS